LKAKIITLFIFICFLWSLLIFRAAYLQFIPHDKLSTLQNRQFQTVVTLPARRGNIYDMNGKELAMSSPSYSLYADPKVLTEKRKVADQLSKIVGMSSREIMSKVSDSSRRFVWLDRLIDATEAEKIRQLNVKGLGMIEDWKRVYPNDSLLGSTLGFVGKEGQALEGIELYQDSILRGEKKQVVTRRDARGRPLVQDGLLFTETPQGKEIKLTIDSELQYFVESEMMRTIREHDADGGWAVVLDAKTSAIRAIASLPTYDPNNPQNANAFQRRNRAVTDTFEPGSTMKSFVIAHAIDEKKIKPNTKIFCENGHFKIGKRVIHEAEAEHAHATITVSEVLAYSSNIGTAKIALQLGDDELKRGLLAFGFGEKSGVDLPGEAKGITVRLPWADHLLANISFGQGITATPLQLANAYAAIANGGVLKRPYIVESITDVETGESQVTKPQEIRRVISEDTAAKMRLMLTGVTSDNGTGISARVPGYIVGGKTGTAQKIKSVGKGYQRGAYIGSFSGFIPANDPQFVIFVGIDYPKKNGYYGTQVAAPLFSKIASYAVRKNGINPEVLGDKDHDFTSNTVQIARQEDPNADKIVNIGDNGTSGGQLELPKVAPYLKTLSMREVLKITGEQKIQVKFVGNGRVETTYPEPGQTLDSDRNMTVILR
jgi:cell division protein FtsI (penicillin-binding protein 3)